MPTLTLVRGLPGSGKSTLARTLPGVHLEADQFFVGIDGQYRFDATQLDKAHLWCKTQTAYHLGQGQDVVVANTFVQQWEMATYRELAKQYKAELIILVCDAEYSSIHDVPTETIARMRRLWES